MPSIKKKRLIADAIPAVKKKRSSIMRHIKKKHSATVTVPPTEVEHSPVFKFTPWYNRDEFLMVASSLFSEDISVIRWALNKIEVWQMRTYPALPVCIDATMCLVRAKLQDAVFAKRISYCSIGGLELMYAQALIRFVNIASEIVQYREKNISLCTALKKLNIPAWILDLRNSCSHSKMPSLADLRYGASYVLDFLQREYWDKECAELQNSFVPSPKKDSIKLERSIYLLIKDCKTYVCKSLPCSADENAVKLKAILYELTNELTENHTTVFDILIRPGLFLMNAEDMPLISGQNFMDTGNFELPMFVLKLWAPLIGVISSLNKIPQFVTRLMELQINMPRFHQKMACAWIWKLIEMVVHDGDGTYDNSDPIFRAYTEKTWMFTWPSLAYVCSTNPSKFMLPILSLIMDQVCPPMPLKAKQELLMVMFFRLSGLNLNNKDVPSSEFDTFSDMQEYIAKEIEGVDGATDLPSKTVWEHYTGPDMQLGSFLAPVPDYIGAPPKMDDGTVDQTSDIQDEPTPNTEPTVNDQIAKTSSTRVQVPFAAREDDIPGPTTDDFY